jgi:hypothetical protein
MIFLSFASGEPESSILYNSINRKVDYAEFLDVGLKGVSWIWHSFEILNRISTIFNTVYKVSERINRGNFRWLF